MVGDWRCRLVVGRGRRGIGGRAVTHRGHRGYVGRGGRSRRLLGDKDKLMLVKVVRYLVGGRRLVFRS